MQKKILFIGFVLMMTSTLQLKAQYAKTDSTYKRCFVGSSMFLLANFATTTTPRLRSTQFWLSDYKKGCNYNGNKNVELYLAEWYVLDRDRIQI